MQDTKIAQFVTFFLSSKIITQLSGELGIVQRTRKVEIVSLVYSLLFATLGSPNSSISDWHRFFCLQAPQPIAYSSFYGRLTPKLETFFEQLLNYFIKKYRSKLTHWLEPYLTDFKQVFAVDASTIQLRDELENTYKACTEGSALKLHSIINVLSFQPHSIKLTSQKDHDLCSLTRIRQWCPNKLLLMDLGYYSFEVFDKIDKSGGYFVSRAKKNFNPVILEDLHQGAGVLMDVEGMKLKSALNHLKRKHLDVVVKLSYNQGKNKVKVRVIASYNEEASRWHIYITNLNPNSYKAHQIEQIYRLRWQVEMFFKHLKSTGMIDIQTSTKEHLVKMKIYMVLIVYILCAKLTQNLKKSDPENTYSVWRTMNTMRFFVGEFWSYFEKLWKTQTKPPNRFTQCARDPNISRNRPFFTLLESS